MSKMSLICINCPLGCQLSVELDETGRFCSVEGNSCPRGAVYAREEVTAPKRMLTTTVKTDSDEFLRLPVVSSGPVLKDRLIDCVNWIKEIEVQLPVKKGDVIVADILGMGINIVASRSLR